MTPITKSSCPQLGESVTELLMSEVRLFAVHDRKNIPCTHLLKTVWVHSCQLGLTNETPGTHHTSTVDVRLCAAAVVSAFSKCTAKEGSLS